MSEFLESCRRLFADYYRPLISEDSCPASAIDAVERRLRISLSATLRAYYSLAGNCVEINEACHYILNPDALYKVGDVLVVCHENQNICFWGIHSDFCCESDPPVLQTFDEDASEWISYCRKLSTFLYEMLFYQILEASPHAAAAIVPTSFLPTIQMNWPREPLSLEFETEWLLFGRPGQLLSLLPRDDGDYDLRIAARTDVDRSTIKNLVSAVWLIES